MGRMTRAKAAEVAERLHVDEDAVLDLSMSDINSATPDSAEREVLGNIAPNSAERKGPVELVTRKTRGKNKGRTAAEAEPEPAVDSESETEQDRENDGSDAEAETHEEQGEVNTENEVADDAFDATTNETMERLAKLRITSLGNQGALQAPTMPEVEQDSTVADIAEVQDTTAATLENIEPENATTSVATSPTKETTSDLPNISIAIPPQQQELEESELDDPTALEAPSSPVATAMPKVIKGLRTETPSKRSTSNKENVEPVEPVGIATDVSTSASPDVQPPSPSQQTPLDAAVTQPATSPSTSHRSNDKTEDPIEAMDDLEDAVDKTNLEISQAPASPGKTQTPKPTAEAEKPKKAKAAPVVRLTKAAAARLSMAQGTNKDASKAPASTRPRSSIMPARAGNVRQSVVPAASSKRIPPTTGNAKTAATKSSPKSKKETTIPHSKPRPVSLSFPTPPPAAKSSKAPTKSTFQLPGEAVAAKLKAAREERAKREATAASSKTASDEKRPAFKARPVPSTLNKAPSVRQTAASRARDPAKAGEIAAKPTTSISTTGLKRSNTAAASGPRPSAARSSAKPSQPSTLTVQKRARPSSMHVSSTSTTTIAAASASATAPRKPSTSSSSGGTAAAAATSRPSTAAPTARIPSGTSSKGKEVYARFGAARDAAENEKREKEDAARKARAAAAERGRAASREWAEKQRVKKMVARVEGQVAGS